jgi:hypothetical protein
MGTVYIYPGLGIINDVGGLILIILETIILSDSSDFVLYWK